LGREPVSQKNEIEPTTIAATKVTASFAREQWTKLNPAQQKTLILSVTCFVFSFIVLSNPWQNVTG
jgi:hypothetical protein